MKVITIANAAGSAGKTTTTVTLAALLFCAVALMQARSPGPLLPALLINTGLLLLFGLQHSVMARPGFKRWITRGLPQSAERSTYVLATSVTLMVVFACASSARISATSSAWVAGSP